MKRFLKMHRLPRKQAALQNLLLTVIVVLIGMFGLRAYSSNYSPEAMVEKWCRENYFGEAEIYSRKIYEDGQTVDLHFGRETREGEHYRGYMSLERRSFNRWDRLSGTAWQTTPVTCEGMIIRKTGEEKDRKTYLIELADAAFFEFFGADLVVTLHNAGGRKLAEVKVLYREKSSAMDSPASEIVRFTADLDERICLESECRWFIQSGGGRVEFRRVKFEFSEERMVYIAETLTEALSRYEK